MHQIVRFHIRKKHFKQYVSNLNPFNFFAGFQNLNQMALDNLNESASSVAAEREHHDGWHAPHHVMCTFADGFSKSANEEISLK